MLNDRPDPDLSAREPHEVGEDEWVTFTRRTEDPKLAYIEAELLLANGIPCRRRGRSFHAPIMQVPREDLKAAWEMLGSDPELEGYSSIDDVPDDHPMFEDWR